jgi:hypothetical protein
LGDQVSLAIPGRFRDYPHPAEGKAAPYFGLRKDAVSPFRPRKIKFVQPRDFRERTMPNEMEKVNRPIERSRVSTLQIPRVVFKRQVATDEVPPHRDPPSAMQEEPVQPADIVEPDPTDEKANRIRP